MLKVVMESAVDVKGSKDINKILLNKERFCDARGRLIGIVLRLKDVKGAHKSKVRIGTRQQLKLFFVSYSSSSSSSSSSFAFGATGNSGDDISVE